MKKCLVIDDVEVTLFTTKRIMTELGVDLVMGNTIEEGLDALRNDTIDVVLLDWHLRRQSGLVLLQKIREEFGNKIPVIMFSGVEGADKRTEALQAGANAFLEKPTTKEKLLTCLQDLKIL